MSCSRASAALLLTCCSVACSGGSSSTDAPAPFTTPGAPLPDMRALQPGAPSAGAEDASRGGPPASAAPGETSGPALPLAEPAAPGSAPAASAGLSQPLPRSTPEAEGASSAGILALVSALDGGAAGEIHGLMLLRHGKVVAEGWWAPYTADDIHALYSVTKSVNATAVGLAVAEGRLSVDDLLLSHLGDLAPAQVDPELAAMKVRDLLTMSTGHQTDSIDAMRQRSDGQWTRSFLEGDVPLAPGSYFLYNSGAAYMLGSLVQRVTGATVHEYLRPRLFEPLGIAGELWGLSQEGVNLGDGGLSLRTEDLAKFGQLYLQGGVWNGEPLLPGEWVSAATEAQVSSGNGDNDWGHGYGYQFWRSQQGYRADGSLGQFAFVLPEQDMVLAITSGTNDTAGVMNIVWDSLPAIVEDAPLEDAAGLEALRERLATLALPLPEGEPTSALAADVSGRRYAMAENPLGVSALTFDVAGAAPRLTIEDADGAHSLALGIGQWARQRTGYRKRINELFDTPEQGVAVAGAWSAEDRFVARIVFTETPYTLTTTFTFEGDTVRVSSSYNVRWGSASEPEIAGTRS